MASPPMPAFMQLSKSEQHNRFVELEWAQRGRLVPSRHPAKKWARVSGDEVTRRNRYSNIDPFLNNRVKLRVPEGYDDYINASPIVLSCSKKDAKKRYIATQGPTESSTAHMWRMVWNETPSVGVIVMLTQTHEGGKEKCFTYFPTTETRTVIDTNPDDEFGDAFAPRVELLDTTQDTASRSTIRKLRLSVGKDEKTIYHFLFEGWPDFLVPEGEDRVALLELVAKTAALCPDPQVPRIVHCSAGVGRSGTFIALDYLLDELRDGAMDGVSAKADPVMATVDELRSQRMMMVQGESQYNFLYATLREQWVARQHGERSGKARGTKGEVAAGS